MMCLLIQLDAGIHQHDEFLFGRVAITSMTQEISAVGFVILA